MFTYRSGEWSEGTVEFPPFEPVVYESLRTYEGKVFALKEHMDRLMRSAKFLGIDRVPVEHVERALSDFKRENDHRFRIYLRPSGEILLEAEEIGPHPGSVHVRISRWRKPSRLSIPPEFKVIGNPATALARLEKGEAYEALMLNSDGFVAEGTFSNVFLVKDGRLKTPSLESGILPGITRKYVIEMARDLGIDVVQSLVEVHELYEADEIFLTHTSQEIVPVSKLNESEFEAPGPVTELLLGNFRRFVLG